VRVAVAVDHAGFPLKGIALDVSTRLGHETADLGTYSTDPVDYPDTAQAAAEAILDGRADRALIVCGSGAGVAVAANKFDGIRAAVCHDTYTAHQCVEHDDVNVLCLGGRVVGSALAEDIIAAFLNAQFSGEDRHRRRLEKIRAIESKGRTT
jgi:ribose 5-phosphate isomerase B